jgi:hypothetical protein
MNQPVCSRSLQRGLEMGAQWLHGRAEALDYKHRLKKDE